MSKPYKGHHPLDEWAALHHDMSFEQWLRHAMREEIARTLNELQPRSPGTSWNPPASLERKR